MIKTRAKKEAERIFNQFLATCNSKQEFMDNSQAKQCANIHVEGILLVGLMPMQARFWREVLVQIRKL